VEEVNQELDKSLGVKRNQCSQRVLEAKVDNQEGRLQVILDLARGSIAYPFSHFCERLHQFVFT
jgi:hypothetical protein